MVGLAPGLKGANATGRPFTGDYAGLVLYEALAKHGFASGQYDPSKFGVGREVETMTAFPEALAKGDGFTLHNVRITNAVRCVPPENKPTPAEEKNCNPFLVSELAAMPQLKLIISLGLTSHQAVLRTLKLKAKDYKFSHGAVHRVGSGDWVLGSGTKAVQHPAPSTQPLLLLDSYHTSRYNVSTGRLTQAMFDGIVAKLSTLL